MILRRLFQKSEEPGSSAHSEESKDKAPVTEETQPGETTEQAVFDVEFAKLRLALCPPQPDPS